MKTINVRVLRAFFYNGKPTKVGETIEVPAVFGSELLAAKKAEAIEPTVKPVTADNSDNETTTAPVARGARNAR